MNTLKKPLYILMVVALVLAGVLGARAAHRQIRLAALAPLRVGDSAADMAQAEAVARSSLPGQIDGIRVVYKDYGFKNEAELDRATLGKPYESYELMPVAVQNHRAGERMLDMAIQRRTWEFPVLVDGEGRSAITAAFFEGRWQAVEFGGSDSGKQLARMEQHLDLLPGAVSLVEIASPSSIFTVLERDGEERIIVLGAWPDVVGDVDQTHFTEYSTDEIMSRLQAYYWWWW